MEKNKIIIFTLLIFAAVAVGLFLFFQKESDQAQVENYVPEKPAPIAAPVNPAQPDTLRVSSPLSGETVKSPLVVTGQASAWYFEAVFSIRVTDEKNNTLGVGYVQAIGDWMTTDFVPFSGTITFDAKEAEKGFVIFEKANPSGLPENELTFSMPVRFMEK